MIYISLQPDDVNLRYFKLYIVLESKNQNLKYKRFPPSGCKIIGIRKLEYVAKTQCLFIITNFFFNLKKNGRK